MKQNLIIVGALAVLVFLSATDAKAQKNYGGGRLAGTWDAAVDVYNCTTAEPIASFVSTANFNQGGTFTGITSGIPPAARTPEIGIWRHDAGNTYTFRFKAYLFNTLGITTGYQLVTHRLELGGDDSYMSQGSARIFNLNGEQIGMVCSSAVGSRMTLD